MGSFEPSYGIAVINKGLVSFPASFQAVLNVVLYFSLKYMGKPGRNFFFLQFIISQGLDLIFCLSYLTVNGKEEITISGGGSVL